MPKSSLRPRHQPVARGTPPLSDRVPAPQRTPQPGPVSRCPAAARPGPASPSRDRPTGLPWEDGAVAEDAAAALLPVASDTEEELEDKDEDEAGPLPSLHGTPAPARC